MRRELRIVGFVVLAAIAFSLLDIYNKQSAKPMPVPLPIADETKQEPPRTIRVIQIYKAPSDQPADPPAQVVEPVDAFPETLTLALPTTPPPSPPTPTLAPPQKTAMDICERVHMHKRFTNGGRSWRCVK
jgi:hypothetical protein